MKILTGKKQITLKLPVGTAKFNEGNAIPDHLLPFVSEADKKYLKAAPKAKEPDGPADDQ